MNEGTYIVEVYKEDDKTMVHISTENETGCRYRVENGLDIGRLVGEYIEICTSERNGEVIARKKISF